MHAWRPGMVAVRGGHASWPCMEAGHGDFAWRPCFGAMHGRRAWRPTRGPHVGPRPYGERVLGRSRQSDYVNNMSKFSVNHLRYISMKPAPSLSAMLVFLIENCSSPPPGGRGSLVERLIQETARPLNSSGTSFESPVIILDIFGIRIILRI